MKRLLLLSWFVCAPLGADVVRVASKNFNESYILSEIASQLLESRGYTVERRFGLGGTLICFEALSNGEIDLYVEYTGTLSQAILKLDHDATFAELNAEIESRGMRLLEPFGFNNTYAMVVKRQRAEALGLRSIGDLRRHPQLEIVVSHEFLEREDGWPGLTRAYGIQHEVVGIEHALAYQAIEGGAVDVTDGYSTDGEIERYDLIALEDDLGFFPKYLAAPLVREGLGPDVIQILGGLGDTLDDAQMQAMTSAVVFDKLSFAEVAQAFLAERGVVTEIPQNPLLQSLATNTLRHLQLTFIALASAIVVGVGLSLVIFRSNHTSKAVIYFCGLLQTIPSIALLALMIPVFGIGFTPAILALFLYSLLPILRNTVTALTTIDPTLLRVAVAMGLSNREQLRYVYVPLSMPSMLAGIRTAAVISIGTATLAAFIGAGGLGEPIVTGLALNDVSLILQGAIPAAMLAIVTELLFEIVERFTVPGHLRD